MSVDTNVLKEAELYATRLMDEHIPGDYVFHNSDHTAKVVEAVREICDGFELTAREVELLQLAAWFHDTGYDQGNDGHELRSCRHARQFMEQYDYSEEDIHLVRDCIMVTRIDAAPQTLLEEILCDADLSHLGKNTYWDLSGKLRMELTLTQGKILSEQEWVEKELAFMEKHQYHTYVAHELYNRRKQKHIRQLHKRKLRLNPDNRLSDTDFLPKKKKKNKKKSKQEKWLENSRKELKQLNLGRGVETMYRTTYRTHVNLSSIADNKANIMLSINAIIVSIVVSTLVPKFNSDPKLILPTVVLLTVCLLSIVYATLSTRPKITEGRVTREDIDAKCTNLLFFGNYYRMPLEEYQYGMMEMIKDSDFLYSSMTRDLYYLGIVLAKKYRYLSICYTIFMYGLIFAVLVFALAFTFF